jgi:hypothetical protein
MSQMFHRPQMFPCPLAIVASIQKDENKVKVFTSPQRSKSPREGMVRNGTGEVEEKCNSFHTFEDVAMVVSWTPMPKGHERPQEEKGKLPHGILGFGEGER